jgi:hypothetical protein
VINLAQRCTCFSNNLSAKYRGNKFTTLVAHFIIGLALTTGVMTNTAHAETNNARGGTSAAVHLNFRIVIPAIVRVKSLSQAASITIEQAHIDRGYIDLDAASSLQLTSNSRRGYMLSANFNAELLEKIEVKLPHKTFHANARSTNMHIESPILIDEVVGVSYRLYLKSHVQAGEYQWPVALTFTPNVV